MPVDFESFVYPVSGRWKSRRSTVGYNLSSSDITFYCDKQFEKEEVIEIIIPITDEPLILKARILHSPVSGETKNLHFASFIDMLSSQETLLREAVFYCQICRAIR